jgi:hypothetical protein
MKSFRKWTVGLATVALTASGVAVAEGSCNASCLNRLMAEYLKDLTRHDPASLKLSANLNARENGHAMAIGAGVWQRITALPVPGPTFSDPELGQVVYFGAAQYGSELGALFVRLVVKDGKITESELFTRGGEPGGKDDFSGLLEPDVLYEAPVPEARRSDRKTMAAIIGRYEDGISEHNGSIPPFSYRCDRYSAGLKWTNNPAVPLEKGGGTCGTSFDGLKGQTVVNRRIAVLDMARGIAVALFIIPHGERPTKGSTNVAEVFKIVDGKIRSIEEFAFPGAYPPESGFQ